MQISAVDQMVMVYIPACKFLMDSQSDDVGADLDR